MLKNLMQKCNLKIKQQGQRQYPRLYMLRAFSVCDPEKDTYSTKRR